MFQWLEVQNMKFFRNVTLKTWKVSEILRWKHEILEMLRFKHEMFQEYVVEIMKCFRNMKFQKMKSFKNVTFLKHCLNTTPFCCARSQFCHVNRDVDRRQMHFMPYSLSIKRLLSQLLFLLDLPVIIRVYPLLSIKFSEKSLERIIPTKLFIDAISGWKREIESQIILRFKKI